MIRRDYILRMLEEFCEALSRIRALKTHRRWQEAAGTLEEQFQRLIGMDAGAAARLTDTELLALLIRGEPTLAVPEKTLLLSTLLREAGDVAAAQDRPEESRACYSKGLHLLLETLGRSEMFECPDFVPRVEVFTAALSDAPLPPPTLVLLMRHYERSGVFARAEDALFALLEADPSNPGIVQFGISFYERLQSQSEASLAVGNLPRSEVDAGLVELRGRQTLLMANTSATRSLSGP
jgi:hypothetical protein